jgi:DNA-methyltransferase (dcm)
MDVGFEGNFPLPAPCVPDTKWRTEVCPHGQVILKPTEFKTVFACDIKPCAKIAWEAYFNRPDTFHLESIVGLVKQAREGSFHFPEADVVTGGFPCQDFSTAGKRMGFNSTKSHDMSLLTEPSTENRGMLYKWMKEVIELTIPKVFIAENVKGLVNLGEIKNIIAQDFRDCGGGYLVLDPQVLQAGEYGVPQSRERVIFIGIRKDALTPKALKGLETGDPQFNPYPQTTHSLTGKAPRQVTVQEAIGDLLEPEVSPDLSQQAYAANKYYGKHCQGNIEVKMQGLAPTIRSEHHGSIEFRRLSPEHGGVNEPLLPERRLSVRECARLQTFPDTFNFVQKGISKTNAYKLVGNAVPPLLAYNIAQRLSKIWDKLFG